MLIKEKSEIIKNDTEKAISLLIDSHSNATNILDTLKNFTVPLIIISVINFTKKRN